MEQEYYESMDSEERELERAYRVSREDEIIKPTQFFAKGLLKIVGLEEERRYYFKDAEISRKKFEAILYGEDLRSFTYVSRGEQRLIDMKIALYDINVSGGNVDFTSPSKRRVEELRAEAIENIAYKKFQDEFMAKRAKEQETRDREVAEYRKLVLESKLNTLEREKQKIIDEKTAIHMEAERRDLHLAEFGWYEG